LEKVVGKPKRINGKKIRKGKKKKKKGPSSFIIFFYIIPVLVLPVPHVQTASNAGAADHVDLTLFKQQLTLAIERIYVTIREHVDTELRNHFGAQGGGVVRFVLPYFCSKMRTSVFNPGCVVPV